MLDEIRAALRMEYLNPPIRNVGADNTLSSERARDAGRKFAAQSRAALAEGRAGEAARNALDALALGSVVGRGAGAIHNLVGCALTATTARALEPVIPRLTAEEAHAAGTRMDRLLSKFPRTADALEEERLGLRESMLLLFRGELDQAAIDKDAPSVPVQRVFWFAYPKPWSLGNVDHTLRTMARETERPYPLQHEVPIANDFFSKTFLPVLKPFPRAMFRRDAIIRILRTEIALQEYRARRGRYPAQLQKLIPDYLPAVPADPYGFGPVTYHRGGTEYVLYSWSADGKDDGGRPIERTSLEEIVPGDLVAGHLTPPGRPRPNGGTP